MNDAQIKTRQESTRKIGFINYLISKTEMASEDDPEFYSKKKRIIVDFSPVHSWQEQKAWLNDFKKRKIIGDFKTSQDCFYLIQPIKLLLYQERERLLKIITPAQKPEEIISAPIFSHRPKKNLLYVKDLKPEIEIKGLGAYSDGTIRYKGEVIKMRNQIKDLCRLFMDHPNRLLTHDDIRDQVVNADRRKSTSRVTIAKYVSELHNLLKIHFKKGVIFSQQQEGWHFKP